MFLISYVNRGATDHSIYPNFVKMYIYDHKGMAVILEDCTSEC